MNKQLKLGFFVVFLLVVTLTGMVGASASGPQVPAAPVSTTFTYQGRLTDGGSPANGVYDLRFSLFDDANAGAQVGSTVTVDDVPVSGGYFTVALDFGAMAFQGAARWLKVEVRPSASAGSYTALTPRTALAGVPYALSLRPGATVNTTTTDVPALNLNASNANSNALVATGNGLGYAVVYAENLSTSGYGLYGKSDGGTAVYGESNVGSAEDPGIGVSGYSPDYGVRGEGYIGVWGEGFDTGVYGRGAGRGVEGRTTSSDAFTYGVYGVTGGGSSSAGVSGIHVGPGPSGIGVWGEHNGTGYGVYGNTPPGGYGVVGSNGGSNTSGYAGSFNGRVAVIGTLSKGGGSFKIDHPLDPANKYLYHSFVESPDMMNIYNGNVTTDADGFATVTMPDWFEALNQDFRYQLTVIGQFAQAIVAEEIDGNQFRIQTDKPLVRVSWQVTGIRQDAYANAHRIPVEEDKPADEQGLYLHPTELGEPAELGLDYQRNDGPLE